MKFFIELKGVYKVILVILFLGSIKLYSQSLPNNISDLSDEELSTYWNEAKGQGYTLDQIKTLARTKGLPSSQVSELERRISSLSNGALGLEGQQINNSLKVSNATPLGITSAPSTSFKKKSSVFGYDFFNNENISFTPNLNVATPDNYQLGPGDELVINIWGASENTYSVIIDREGALRIPNVGPVFVNGMEIKTANEIINNKLKTVYSGINAPTSSPYKVFVNTSLSKVRSVQVNIIGEVNVPGTYTLNSLSTVLNALYAAGGPTTDGTFREIKLVRAGKDPVLFDVYKYLLDGDQSGNVTLKDQDLIIVSPYISRIKISGAVKQSGIFELKGSEDFVDLLKYASGFKPNAFKEKFIVERIKGDGKEIKEVPYSNIFSEKLSTGDEITVRTIIDYYRNKITINGPLFREGNYEFREGLTINELIEKASGLKDEAYLGRGLIFRYNGSKTREVIPFSLQEILEGKSNVELQVNDIVKIFNKEVLKTTDKINITGAIRNSGSIEYFDNITIEDALLMAGGFTDAANINEIDVYRKINDDDFVTLAESFKVSVEDDGLDYKVHTSFELMPGDRIAVRSLKGFDEAVSVTVEGEVNLPGVYSTESKNERISDLINKVGGLSPYAFVKGATLIRLNPYYNDDAQNIVSEELNEINVNSLSLMNKKEFRVGINLEDILSDKNQNSSQNMVLKNGDRIIIPSVKETVKTEGELIVPSLIRHDASMRFKEYIEKSGGFSSEALRRKAYVIHSNGDISTTKTFLFFKSYPRVTPGALILVPKKKRREDPLEAEEVIGLTSGLATLALLIDRISR